MDSKVEGLLISSVVLAVLTPISFYGFKTPILAGLLAISSLIVYRYVDGEGSKSSLTDLDELKLVYSQKSIEILLLLTAVSAPSVSKPVAVAALLLVFLGETIRDETEAVSKQLIKPYAGFELRALVLGIGFLGQSIAAFSLFYSLVLVSVLTLYEITRTIRISVSTV